MAALVADYTSSGEEDETETVAQVPSVDYEDSKKIFSSLRERFPLDSAPVVPNRETSSTLLKIDPQAKEVTYNPTYDQLFAPEAGPTNPFKTGQSLAKKNMATGFVEAAHIDHFQFENQRRTFHSYGYAVDPTSDKAVTSMKEQFVGELDRVQELDGATVFERKVVRTGEKRKREAKGDPGVIDGYMGPWRAYKDQIMVSKPTEEQKVILDAQFKKKHEKQEEEEETMEEIFQLHIDDPYDYLGRSFLHIPQDVDADLRAEEPPEKCFAPKKCIHTWTGHTKGVAAIRLFPKSGHLVLSAGMDCKIKLWEVYRDRRCVATYYGHLKAVRDICFNNDGTQFLSCSYDRYIKLWDTETGKCLGRFSNQKTPYCIKFNPDEDKQHLFVVGCSDKKIYTWDTRTEEIVQEYDRHLGSVNSVTFVDENRRFVTTSDDKSIRVWEWDIPIDMKYIAEPHMHSMPFVTVDPSGKWLACQSMNNEILMYGVHTNFRLNRRKTFKGHNVAGYACQVDFSPDGSMLASGEADGRVCFWEWKNKRIRDKIKAHGGVCIGCLWLPHETSKVVTCGWDGTIKLWD